MKLFYSPQVCSLVPHIILRELGVEFELEKVDFKTKHVAHGGQLTDITPKDYVPVLELDDGNRLTELSVIIRYIADQHPDAKLIPAPGTFERVRFEELLHFVSTELHKGFAPFSMMPNVGEESIAWAKHRLASRAEILRTQLGDRQFIFGDSFTIADPYTFWALRAYGFLTRTKLDGTLKDYMARMTEWPSIKESVDLEKRA